MTIWHDGHAQFADRSQSPTGNSQFPQENRSVFKPLSRPLLAIIATHTHVTMMLQHKMQTAGAGRARNARAHQASVRNSVLLSPATRFSPLVSAARFERAAARKAGICRAEGDNNSVPTEKPHTYTVRTTPSERVLKIWQKAECVCFDGKRQDTIPDTTASQGPT